MKQPPQRSGTPSRLSHSCFFLLATCLLLSDIASAAPSITLSKKTGPPTSRILVSGRGFEPNVGVDIYFDTKDEALIVTDGRGEFKDARAHAPRSAYPGKHWVTALERNNDKGAQKPFLVQTNWSQFNFDADGTRWNPYENVLNSRNVVNLDVKWTYTAQEAISSSAAVVDGVLYIGGGFFNHYFNAIHANTGTLLWSFAAKGATWTSPAVANGVVYFGSADANVYALDAHTGALIWNYTTGNYVDSSPAVVDGVVYVGSDDGNLYALDARTGAKLWAYTTGGPVESAPVVTDGVVYFGADDDNVYALRASNGALLWHYETGSFVNGLAVTDGMVYATSQDHSIYALSASNGARLWSFATGGPIYSAPAVANGVIYIGSDDTHGVYALNARTGDELWSGNGPVVSSPAVANGVVYVNSWYYEVYALDPRNGAVLWNYFIGEMIESSPTIANGVLYTGIDAYVYAFSLHDGSQQAGAASKRPDLKTLRPDFSLKVSKPDATASPH